MTLDEYFAGQPDSRRIFDALRSAIDTLGPAQLRVTKSQVAFRQRRAFAWAWMPGAYLLRFQPTHLHLKRWAVWRGEYDSHGD